MAFTSQSDTNQLALFNDFGNFYGDEDLVLSQKTFSILLKIRRALKLLSYCCPRTQQRCDRVRSKALLPTTLRTSPSAQHLHMSITPFQQAQRESQLMLHSCWLYDGKPISASEIECKTDKNHSIRLIPS